MTSFSGVSQCSRPHSAAEVQQGHVCSTPARPRGHCRPAAPRRALHCRNLTHRWWSEPRDIEDDVYPWRLRLISALNCTPPGTLTRFHFSFHTLGPPLHTAQALHEVVTEEYRILESVNYELVTCTPADWVRLFETRFSLSVEHLRQRFPQGTDSLLSVLARVLSGVLASLALLCVASDFVRDCPLSVEATPSRIRSSAWFLSCVVWVSFRLGLAEGMRVKPRWFGPPLSSCSPTLLSLAPFQRSFLVDMFSHLSLNLCDLTSHGDCHILLVKKKLPVLVPQTVRPPHWMPGEVRTISSVKRKTGRRRTRRFSLRNCSCKLATRGSPVTSHSILVQPFQEKTDVQALQQWATTFGGSATPTVAMLATMLQE